MAIPFTDDRCRRLNEFVERLLFAYKNEGITVEKASAELLAVIEAAASDDWVVIEERLNKAEFDIWDD